MIDISLGFMLGTLTTLPVQQDVISANDASARVWFQRSEANTELFTDGSPGLTTTTFNAEVATLNIDQTQTEASNIRTALNGYRGWMGLDFVKAVFVLDAADDYIPRNLMADEGFHVAAFVVQIITG